MNRKTFIMNRKTFTALCMAGIFTAAGATKILETEQTVPFGPVGQESRHFVYPLEELGVGFSCDIEVLPEASAVILCEGDTVAKSVRAELSYNYKDVEGFAAFCFDKQNLPKGKSYSFVVAPSSIRSVTNPEKLNGRIEVPFLVPADLGPARWGNDDKDGIVIASAPSLVAYWGYETEKAVENPYAVLYREGVEVRTFPLSVAWDWNLGQARVQFVEEYGDELHFEKDIHYKVTIPAGMVGVAYRTDIVNEETSFSFVGGYEQPLETPKYHSIQLHIDKEANTLQRVDYVFDSYVVLGADPKVRLWTADMETLVKEVVPYVNHSVNCLMISADFDNVPLDDEKGNAIELTEGSVVYSEGNPVANQKAVVPITGQAGIAGIDFSGDGAELPVYDIYGRAVSEPVRGQLYIRGGKKFMAE